MAERFFPDLAEEQLRPGVFTSLKELIAAKEACIRKHNRTPKPFICTAKAWGILKKIKRARATQSNCPSA